MTLFSHIVSRRLSGEYENIATESLLYLLSVVPKARRALVALLRAAEPGISTELIFVSQLGEDATRPDLAGRGPMGRSEVFVENKFWAGLTERQPVDYLRRLAKAEGPSLLVLVVPEARAVTVWNELERRLVAAEIAGAALPTPPGFTAVATTTLGPRIALTTWSNVINCLSYAVVEHAEGKVDLEQLRSLCDAADRDAFVPFTPEQLSDQASANAMVQLSDLVKQAVDDARAQSVVNLAGLRATHNWRRAGAYLRLGGASSVGAWFGLDFGAWRRFGRTPIWVRFEGEPFSRTQLVRPVLHQWGVESKRLVLDHESQVLVGVDLPAGDDRDGVLKSMVAQLDALRVALAAVVNTGAGAPPDVVE
jgi:hypothetical protein